MFSEKDIEVFADKIDDLEESADKLTKQIKEKDLITVRGKGRFEIAKIEGETRNSRLRLVINKYI